MDPGIRGFAMGKTTIYRPSPTLFSELRVKPLPPRDNLRWRGQDNRHGRAHAPARVSISFGLCRGIARPGTRN
jgi:hypothetical protein